MVVSNSDESPSFQQVLGAKVKAFSLASQKNETHLNQTKRECKINMWGHNLTHKFSLEKKG